MAAMNLTQAIILAGGRGERLRPLTTDRPKPMISVFDRPLLAYALQWLKEAGIEDVVISCGYRHDVIRDYFKDGSELGLKIQYSIEDQPLGRGGGIKLASHMLQAEPGPILVANGDVITDLPLADLLTEHTTRDALATVVTVPLRSPYGIADVGENGFIKEFREKPELPYWINAGIYLLNWEVLARFPDQGDHEDTLFPKLAAEGALSAYQFKGFWRAIDTAKDLAELRQELERHPPLKSR
jgi:NDP-sugar pyrophosphorylase family protein